MKAVGRRRTQPTMLLWTCFNNAKTRTCNSNISAVSCYCFSFISLTKKERNAKEIQIKTTPTTKILHEGERLNEKKL